MMNENIFLLLLIASGFLKKILNIVSFNQQKKYTL